MIEDTTTQTLIAASMVFVTLAIVVYGFLSSKTQPIQNSEMLT